VPNGQKFAYYCVSYAYNKVFSLICSQNG